MVLKSDIINLSNEKEVNRMITITRTITQKIDEKKIFDEVKDFLFEEEIEIADFEYEDFCNLSKDVQRLIFAKVGAMMIDYAGSEEF
jgi:hypothetical protein